MNNTISYTQFSIWKQCPRRWELGYIKKLRSKEPSIHTVFGTAMHEVIQGGLKKLYMDKQIFSATPIELLDTMHSVYVEEVNKQMKIFSSPDELTEIYSDGVEILNELNVNWKRYYPIDNQELIGVEVPIDITPNAMIPNLKFLAYIDVATYNTDIKKYHIQDIKTSKDGWNRYQLADESKISQLILYRYFYAMLIGVDTDDIMVSYLILKRKSSTPSRIQIHEIVNDKMQNDAVISDFNRFITNGFNLDGSHNTNGVFEAVSGKNESNCMFCEFNNEDMCPRRGRK